MMNCILLLEYENSSRTIVSACYQRFQYFNYCYYYMIKSLFTCMRMPNLFDCIKNVLTCRYLIAPKEKLIYIYGPQCVKFLNPPLSSPNEYHPSEETFPNHQVKCRSYIWVSCSLLCVNVIYLFSCSNIVHQHYKLVFLFTIMC